MTTKFKMKQKMDDGSYRELRLETPIKQIEKVDVIAPQTVDIPITDDGSFRRPPIEILKMQAGNAQTVTMDFDAADAAKFIVGGESADQSPYVTFDGTAKLVTGYDVAMSAPEVLGNGVLVETDEIDPMAFKKIDKIFIDAKYGSSIRQIETGKNSRASTFAILNNGTVLGWGKNDRGELGMAPHITPKTPTLIPELADVKQLSAGLEHTAAILRNGTVKVWGDDRYGQIGLGYVTSEILPPTLIPDLVDVKQIIATRSSTFALLNNGTVMGWGLNSSCELGISDLENRTVPTLIPGLTDVKQLSAGRNTAFALLNNGTVMGWGPNSYGEALGLGGDPTKQYFIPTLIPGLTDVKQISAGDNIAFALLNNGTVMGWGHKSDICCLGFPDGAGRSPTLIPGLTDVKQIIAGSSFATSRKQHSFAILNNGTVMGWGVNNSCELGLDQKTKIYYTPMLIPNFVNAKQITAGSDVTFVCFGDSTVKACGLNVKCQLGISPESNKGTMPTQLGSFTAFTSQLSFIYLQGDVAYAGKQSLIKVADNFSSLSTADKKALFTATNSEIAAIDEIVKLGTVKIMVYIVASKETETTCVISAIPLQQLLQPKSLISIDQFTQATIAANFTGSNAIKLIVTTDGNSYKTFRRDAWQDIDHTDIAAVSANGIDSKNLSSITARQWLALLGGGQNIGFAYLLDMDNTTDTCAVDRLELQIAPVVSLPGWAMATPCTDYNYEYTSDSLHITLLTDGSYKVNYQE